MHGFVLSSSPYREYDVRVSCYTKESGKHTYEARGALRPHSLQQKHIDVLSEIEFLTIEGRGYPIIKSAQSIRTFQSLKSSLPALAMAQIFTECFETFVYDNQSDEHLWRFLSDTIYAIDQAAQSNFVKWREFLPYYYQRFVQTMGYPTHDMSHELQHAQLASVRFFYSIV